MKILYALPLAALFCVTIHAMQKQVSPQVFDANNMQTRLLLQDVRTPLPVTRRAPIIFTLIREGNVLMGPLELTRKATYVPLKIADKVMLSYNDKQTGYLVTKSSPQFAKIILEKNEFRPEVIKDTWPLP